jgi:hypothetical protein
VHLAQLLHNFRFVPATALQSLETRQHAFQGKIEAKIVQVKEQCAKKEEAFERRCKKTEKNLDEWMT